MLPSCCSHTRKMLQRMGARWEMLAQRCVMLVSSLILTVSDPVTPGQPSFLKVSSGTNPSMVGLQPLPKPRFLISTFYQTWQQSLNHSFSWSQFLPLNGTGVTLCSFCPHLHKPGPCILGGWPHCGEWTSFGTVIAPQDSFRYILLYSLKTVLFSRARVGSASA